VRYLITKDGGGPSGQVMGSVFLWGLLRDVREAIAPATIALDLRQCTEVIR
jgi:hypothetical protein